MKVSRLFTIDVDVAERLSSIPNASKLVNDLLSEHLLVRNSDPLKEEQLKKKQLQSKMKQINGKINARKRIDALGIDQKCLNWLKGNYPHVQKDDWERYVRSRGKKISLDLVLEILKKNEWLLD